MSDTKTPVDNAELRELLSQAIKRLEHVTGCDMHFFHPDATRCDGKTSMGECNHLRTCELIFEARKALAKPPRNCDKGTADEQLERFIKKWESVGYGEIDERSIHMMSIFSRWAQLRYESEVPDESK